MPPLRHRYQDEPHPGRLRPDHPLREEILRRHARAAVEGRPSYTDPVSGLQVLTATLLALRDECCASGCRHCPYVGAEGT